VALSPVPSPLPTPGDLLPVDGTTLPADVTHAATQGAALLSLWVPALLVPVAGSPGECQATLSGVPS